MVKFKRKSYSLSKEKILAVRNWPIEEDSNLMWNKMSSIIRRVAKYIFGELKGQSLQVRESWWWNGEVQKTIKEKRTY